MITYRLRKKRNVFGEYVVKAYLDGKRYPNADYYTDDWEDAMLTAAHASGVKRWHGKTKLARVLTQYVRLTKIPSVAIKHNPTNWKNRLNLSKIAEFDGE